MPATLTFHFRPRGPARFAVGGFLTLWLGGWAAGEVFVLFTLSRLLREWTGAGPMDMSVGKAAAVTAFLLLWVSLWTMGGVMAIREWLRCFWADERLVVTDDVLTLHTRLGPFVRRQRIGVGQIRRCAVRSRHQQPSALVAELENRVIELTRLGTAGEREQAAAALNAAFALDPAAPADPVATDLPQPLTAQLPRQWQELEAAFCDAPLLVPTLRIRRRQTAVTAVITLLLLALLGLLGRSALADPSLWPVVAFLALPALGCGWGTVWLLLGRRELRLERHQLVVQRRFGRSVREVAQLDALELVESTDSDGDRWYKLQGLRSEGKPLTLESAIRDPADPRALGHWLQQRTQIPYRDAIPSESEREEQRAAALLELKQRLGETGRAGSWMLKLVERIETDKKRPPAPPA
ncbi:MAG: hypothetical protein DCF18_02190 [Cyanobium sp.]|uniref:hypothetical protein n=1 Tax=Synechococcus sp. CS-1333 TaxID=2848638 RepID=UPI000DBC25BB|nr:hypothetical protein [Synechococcus sp. CS-1333]MCT0211558.1 hypothetical protein [Synechococcus sp. CS-1333]PZV24635.1 MAG: hypothetical protein DCF18_02190 [Cyanobium sp.]